MGKTVGRSLIMRDSRDKLSVGDSPFVHVDSTLKAIGNELNKLISGIKFQNNKKYLMRGNKSGAKTVKHVTAEIVT